MDIRWIGYATNTRNLASITIYDVECRTIVQRAHKHREIDIYSYNIKKVRYKLHHGHQESEYSNLGSP